MVLAQKKIYNILLLGQTGSGKSTFINSFFNYISFENINDLLTPESNVKYCVPTFFEWNDPCSDEDKQYRVALGKHEEDNERQQIGSSGTQDVRCYLFNIGNIGIRLIDSPGFGDTLGERKDEDISENLLQFLTIHEDIRELHAILFVFKPQDSKMTVFFQYCMNHILSKLHKSASGNICFLFTHTKATDYKPGPTSALIKNKIDELQDVNILFEKKNKFCVEDDCFHYISAYYYNTYGLNFDDDTKSYFILPWEKSSKECIR